MRASSPPPDPCLSGEPITRLLDYRAPSPVDTSSARADSARMPTLNRLLFGALLVAGCSSSAVDVTLDPPPPGRGFQIDQGGCSLESGKEAVYCMRTPIPKEYRDGPLLIRGVESRLPRSTHHFFMAYGKEPMDGPRPCFGDSGLVPTGA